MDMVMGMVVMAAVVLVQVRVVSMVVVVETIKDLLV